MAGVHITGTGLHKRADVPTALRLLDVHITGTGLHKRADVPTALRLLDMTDQTSPTQQAAHYHTPELNK